MLLEICAKKFNKETIINIHELIPGRFLKVIGVKRAEIQQKFHLFNIFYLLQRCDYLVVAIVLATHFHAFPVYVLILRYSAVFDIHTLFLLSLHVRTGNTSVPDLQFFKIR